MKIKMNLEFTWIQNSINKHTEEHQEEQLRTELTEIFQ